MQNVVLTVHLILAALLILVVLLQRSEGGGLGIGGGGGGGVMTGRQAANALSRATWGLAVAFLITSLVLTILAARSAGTGSVIDRIGGMGGSPPATAPVGNLPALPSYQPPPAAGQPVLPPVPQAPAGEAAAPSSAPVTPPAAAPVTPPAAAPAATPPATAEPASAPADSGAAADPATRTRVITVPVTEPPAAPAAD